MKCPKCGYLGIEQVDRCRNCGYDFVLDQAAPPELPLKDAAERRRDEEQAGSGPTELPLFGDWLDEDRPLISRPSPPRPPLAVRRATPEAPRVRSNQPRMPTLNLDLDPPHDPAEAGSAKAVAAEQTVPVEAARNGARLAAVMIDSAVLAVIDAAVLYFTLQVCGIGVQDLRLIPRVPFFTFLFMLNGGYLVAFTAGGQTLGKMALGIRVVRAGPRSSLDVGRALARELIWLVLAMPAGLGLLPVVFSRDHRGLHDRLAGTRVVRTS